MRFAAFMENIILSCNMIQYNCMVCLHFDPISSNPSLSLAVWCFLCLVTRLIVFGLLVHHLSRVCYFVLLNMKTFSEFEKHALFGDS